MINDFDTTDLKKIYIPAPDSHKGQNGKLLIVGGSRLFHGASFWALKVATRIVDMVFYSSVDENLEIAKQLKSELFDFIAVPRGKIANYAQETDAILIGPGLPREEGRSKDEKTTRELTKELFNAYPNKKWIVDGGSLTEIDKQWILGLNGNCILTPHLKEFKSLFGLGPTGENALAMAKKYNCVILLKGQTDYVCSPNECVKIEGGNAGMTKGGTGDVLAGLVAAQSTKNDIFLSAKVGSYINKKAGESLYKRVGFYFNASDLADEIPKIMKELGLDR